VEATYQAFGGLAIPECDNQEACNDVQFRVISKLLQIFPDKSWPVYVSIKLLPVDCDLMR